MLDIPVRDLLPLPTSSFELHWSPMLKGKPIPV